jgi:protein TonB
MGQSYRAGRVLTAACFSVILAVHIAVLSRFEGFTRKQPPHTRPRELALTLEVPVEVEAEGDKEASTFSDGEEVAPLPAVIEERIPAEPVLEAEDLPQAQEADPQDSRLDEASESGAGSFSGASSSVAEGTAALVRQGSGLDPTGAAPQARPVSAPPHRMSNAEYLALIMRRLEKNKIYPRSVRKRGIEGDVTVHFTIRRDGTVSDIRLAEPSGHRFLGQAAVETIRSASPFPVMEGLEGEYRAQVNIRYRLEEPGTQDQ